MMRIISDISEARQAVRELQSRGKRVGLVPTMGALHAGHVSLIEAARRECEAVAVTIFVNPTQFGPNEDYSKYPRPIEADIDACRRTGAEIVFTPQVDAMYPSKPLTTIHVAKMADGLCGKFRPGHFDGVATVVSKLFHVLPTDAAYFGQKDYQQLMIIKQMVSDLNIPIDIVGCPIVRESDGLAMSSRNVYLNPAERKQATSLSRGLFAAMEQVKRGEREAAQLVAGVRSIISKAGPATIEYVEVVDAATLEPLHTIDRAARICLAVRIGACRLIDNVGVDVNGEVR